MTAIDYLDLASECFFHYTTRDAAFEYILPGRRLRFSPLSTMRDPLENKEWGFPGSAWNDPDPEATNRAYMTFHMHANQIRESAHLLSLTLSSSDVESDEDGLENGWSRARMWEQYAERHAGVCLVFRRQALTDAIIQSLMSQDLAPPYYKPVTYSGEFTEGPVALDLLELVKDHSPSMVRRWVEDHNDALFFRKSTDWRTENEYRFVVTASEPGKPVLADYDDALDVVIVGERFPKWQRPGAIAACAAVGVMLVQISWYGGRPFLHPLAAEPAQE